LYGTAAGLRHLHLSIGTVNAIVDVEYRPAPRSHNKSP
jgi:hypothetical protein